MIQARQEEIGEEERGREEEGRSQEGGRGEQERRVGEGEQGAELLVAAGIEGLQVGDSATATVRLLYSEQAL